MFTRKEYKLFCRECLKHDQCLIGDEKFMIVCGDFQPIDLSQLRSMSNEDLSRFLCKLYIKGFLNKTGD